MEAHFFHASHLHTPSLEMHHKFLMPSIGNNDVEPDYHLPLKSNSSLLRAAADAWASEITAEERADVLAGGYLAREVTPGFIVVSLNTVLYSPKHTPDLSNPDPLGQIAWLNATLTKAAADNKTVAVVGHIPPALASYDDSPPNHAFASFWEPQYMDTLYELLAQHTHVVPAMLFGHLHSDEFRVDVSLGHDAPPLLIAGSVTPAFGNNPSFRTVTYDNETGEILDYEVFVLRVDQGATSFESLYRFSDIYQGVKPDRQGLLSVACDLERSKEALSRFARFNKADAPGAYDYSGHTWACISTQVEVAKFHACDKGGDAGVCTSTATTAPAGNMTTAPMGNMTTAPAGNMTTPGANITSTPLTTPGANVTSTPLTTPGANVTSTSLTTPGANATSTPLTNGTTTTATTATAAPSNATTTASPPTTASTTTSGASTTTTKSPKSGGSGDDRDTKRLSALGAGMGVVVALVVVGVVLVARYVSRRQRTAPLYEQLHSGEPGDDAHL